MKKFHQKLFTLLAVFVTMTSTLGTPAFALADELTTTAQTELVENDNTTAAEVQTEDSTSDGKVTPATENSEPPTDSSSSSEANGETANANDSPVTTDDDAELPYTTRTISAADELHQEMKDKEALYVIDGVLYYQGEELYIGGGDSIVPAKYEELLKAGVAQTLTTASTTFRMARSVNAGQQVTIEFKGYVSATNPYGYTSTVGDFRIDGQQAFCVQHHLPTPATGMTGSADIYDDQRVRNALYYGWGGPANIFSDYNVGMVVTSLVLDRIISGGTTGQGFTEYAALWERVNNGTAPRGDIHVNRTDSDTRIEGSYQVSEDFSIWSDSNPSDNYDLGVPEGVELVSRTSGNVLGAGTHTISSGDTFFLRAALTYSSPYSSNSISSKIGQFQPIVASVGNGYQSIGFGQWVRDPLQSVQINVNFEAKTGIGRVLKTDEAGQPLANTLFRFENETTGETVEMRTDGNGLTDYTATNNDVVRISEIEAPHGYVRDGKTETVTIVAGETQTVTFTNALQTAQFKLLKEDSETGNTPQGQATLEGAIYGLYDATGQELERVTISKDADGNYSATTKDTYAIETGYYFQEITAPTGYLKSDEKIAVTAAYAGQDVAVSKVTATAKEAVKKGGFDGIKVSNYDWRTTAWNAITQANGGDNIQQPLAGVEFTVYQNFGANSEVAKTTTDAQGFFEVTDLPYGTYRVSETKTPVGYQTIDDFFVTISEHGQTFHYSIVDKVVEAKIQFVKVDAETGKRVVRSNAGFEIYSETTGEQLIQKDLNNNDVSVFYTDDKGELNFPTMFAFGSYKAVEVKAPNGYVVADQPFYFDVTGTEANGVVVVEMTNMPVKGQFVVNKTVETGTGVVEKESEFGNYFDIQYMQQAGAGFQFKARALEDITTADGTVRTAKGAFVQYNGADVVVTTDANGKATSPVALYPGKYEAVEVTAPAGVVKADPTPFEIKYEGQSVNVTSTSVSVENSLNSIDITGYKQQEVVAGWEDGQAVIELENAKNGQVFSLNIGQDVQLGNTTLASGSSLGYTTVKDGQLSFANLTLPNQKLDLYLSEVYAGEDHVLSEDQYNFTYTPTNNNETHTIQVWADSFVENKVETTPATGTPIVNELARATVKLTKVDGLDNLPLEDVAFNLVRIDVEGDDAVETVVGKYATNAEGEIVVQDLPTGNYRFDETRPLDWYEDNDQDLSFTVTPTEDGTVIELNAVNERKPLEIVTDFATTKDGHKQINPDIDNELTDYGTIEGMKEGHTYYVDTFYMNQDKEVVDQTSFEIIGDGTQIQEFETDLTVPKGTLGDGQILAAKHIIYSDPEKENEVGRHNEDLDDPKQMVDVKTPKVTIKTKAHTGNGSNSFTYGDVINMYDDVEITHDDVLDGTKRAFKTILVAALPDGTEKDIWESDVIDYVVSDAVYAKTVVTEKIDTSNYPQNTRFYFKEEGINEGGEKDTEHNFDGKDKEQDLYGLIPKLPQTGETIGAISFATITIIAIVGAAFYFMGRKKEEQQ
ncbi:SpaA isopeptide-forming pilin-related protein [Enterococcus sp. LJL90]